MEWLPQNSLRCWFKCDKSPLSRTSAARLVSWDLSSVSEICVCQSFCNSKEMCSVSVFLQVNMVPCLSEMSVTGFCGKDKRTLKDWAQLVSKLTGFTAAVNSCRLYMMAVKTVACRWGENKKLAVACTGSFGCMGGNPQLGGGTFPIISWQRFRWSLLRQRVTT